MMDVSISVTGVCAYVPDIEFSDHTTKVCVLMPDAGSRKIILNKRSFEMISLKRHVPILIFPLRALNRNAYDQSDGVYYLNRLAVYFKYFRGSEEISVDAADSGNRKSLKAIYTPQLDRNFESPEELEEVGRRAAKGGDFAADLAWIPNILNIVPESASKLDRDIFDPAAQKITTRILFDHGTMSSAAANPHLWEMRHAFKGRTLKTRMTHQALISVKNVDRVEVHFRPLDGGTPPQPLRFEKPEKLKLGFHSACDLNALAWYAANPDTASLKGGWLEDDDFRWHYELLDRDCKDILLNEIKARKFLWINKPSPVPSLKLSSLGVSASQGSPLNTFNNCIGIRAPATDVDSFWRIFP